MMNNKEEQIIKYYKDGKLNGNCISFDEDGNITNIIDYKDDKKHGFWRGFYNGWLMWVEPYKDNKKHGKKIFYNKDGTINKVEIYKNGVLIDDE